MSGGKEFGNGVCMQEVEERNWSGHEETEEGRLWGGE